MSQLKSNLIVMAKESGQSCFPNRNDPSVSSVLDNLLQNFPHQKDSDWPPNFAGGIAHRLDIPTSGQLLVAQTPEDLTRLRALFAEKKLLKTYYFLSQKEVSWSTHHIQNPIGHDRRKKKKMVVKRGENTPHRGKWHSAETWFQKMAQANGCTLWRAQMRSGVMHQIRIHAAIAGIALWGDALYGGGASPDFFPSSFALHHWAVSFPKDCGFVVPKPIPIPSWWPDWTKEPILR